MEDGGFIGDRGDRNTRSELLSLECNAEVVALAHVLADVHRIATRDNGSCRIQDGNRIDVSRDPVLSVNGILDSGKGRTALVSTLAQESAQRGVPCHRAKLIGSGYVPDVHGLSDQ